MSPSVVSGLAGGLLATVVASTVFALAGRDRPLPAARLWDRHVAGADRAGDPAWVGLVLTTVGGTLAGGLFAVLVRPATDPTGDLAVLAGLAWGVAFGLVLLAIHVGGVLHAVLDVPMGRERLATFLVLHVIYGAVLGGWTALGLVSVLGGSTG